MRVAIIPARAGSKGLPGKNLQQVGGLSLLARAILAAADSASIDRVIVTTDGEAIAEEARQYHAEIVMRPAALSQDDSTTIDAVLHALREKEMTQGVCVLLQATSPLRTAADVRTALDIWLNLVAGSVIGMTECEHHPYKVFIQSDSGLSPVRLRADMETPRQKLPPALRVNGAIYINKIEDLLQQRSFLIDPITPYTMPAERSLDIDNHLDLKLANLIAGI